MIRIQFRPVGGGTVYELPINPHLWTNLDSDDINIVQILDGAPVRQETSFDGRLRTFEWPAYENTNTTFTGMISVLKSYKGLEKELNTQDLDYQSHGWKKVMIDNIETFPIQGGILRYKVVLTYHYSEAI